ncbi:hypothetical protein [Actinophytocola sp.]|uniref:hypothetical protein n=1 Tax=Actinophytocola sp. TaxID=1872138 RepID=UPI003D6C411D
MTEPVSEEERIESALRELGGRLTVPAPPADLATAVLARLDEPAPHPRTSPRTRPLTRLLPRIVAAAVALLLALAAAMAVSPTVRAAVFDFLRIGGVQIHFEPPPAEPTTTTDTTTDTALPGERDLTLAEAREAVRFDVTVPTLLGDPGSVRVIDDAPSDADPPRVVSLRYAGARLDQCAGRISPIFEKFTRAADVVRTHVGDAVAVWIPRPHPILYVDEHGQVHEESARLAARTLIWEANGVTYRLEGDLTRERAVLIAESMR